VWIAVVVKEAKLVNQARGVRRRCDIPHAPFHETSTETASG